MYLEHCTTYPKGKTQRPSQTFKTTNSFCCWFRYTKSSLGLFRANFEVLDAQATSWNSNLPAGGGSPSQAALGGSKLRPSERSPLVHGSLVYDVVKMVRLLQSSCSSSARKNFKARHQPLLQSCFPPP